MAINVTHYGEVSVLAVAEDLTGENVEEFAVKSKKLADESRHDVVVDLTEAEGIDSKGLESLLELQAQCESGLGHIRLCGLNPTCVKILEITRLARRFEMYPDLDTAVRSFG